MTGVLADCICLKELKFVRKVVLESVDIVKIIEQFRIFHVLQRRRRITTYFLSQCLPVEGNFFLDKSILILPPTGVFLCKGSIAPYPILGPLIRFDVKHCVCTYRKKTVL